MKGPRRSARPFDHLVGAHQDRRSRGLNGERVAKRSGGFATGFLTGLAVRLGTSRRGGTLHHVAPIFVDFVSYLTQCPLVFWYRINPPSLLAEPAPLASAVAQENL
jgi:hypothetical protein